MVAMTTPGRPAPMPSLLVHAAATGIAIAVAGWPVAAQPPAPSTPAAAAFDGRDFAGRRFPIAPIAGPVEFAAARAWAWREGSCRRLLLSGDVRVTLATHRFQARHAAVWIEEISPGVEQIFVAFDRVGNPQDASAFGIAAERLPVRAVIMPQGPIQLACDAAAEGSPDRDVPEPVAAFLPEAQAMLATSLARLDDPQAGRLALAPPPFVRTLRFAEPRPAPATTVVSTPSPQAPRERAAASRPQDDKSSRSRLLRDLAAREGGSPTAGDAPASAARADTDRPSATPVAGDRQRASGTESTTGQAAADAGQAASGPTSTDAAPSSQQAPLPTLAQARRAAQEEIFAKDGIISLGAPDVQVVTKEDETAIMATGGVTATYADIRTGRVLQLTAQRLVVFMDPVRLEDAGRLSVSSIRGMYLEGDVTATDGKFTLRGPQIYYDIRRNSAIMLDAVFWTYDERRQLPLYVRAASIQQTAAAQFTATKATLTNTAMLDPELSIGASSVTITRQTASPEQGPLDAANPASAVSTTTVQAEGVTLRAGGVPIFYWPRYSGDPALMPVKDLRVENREGSGVAVKATLNAYALLGLKKPGDGRFDLFTDYYFERGPALGARLGWNNPDSKGGIMGYMVPFDAGSDLLKPGTKLSQNDDFRGILVGDQRWRLDERWSLFAEGSYISDPTLVDAFFEDQGETRREFTNRLRADRTDGNTQFSLEAKGTFNDFISNEWLLQSQGYSVSKIPEATYVRQADDLLAAWRPGLVSYWSEYRVGAMQVAFDEIEPGKRGFTTVPLSQRAFALDPTQSSGDRLRALGMSEETITRADTRHEVTFNGEAGPVRIQPFMQGRVTAYDTAFTAFSPQEEDETRLQGAVGVRASTSFERIHDGVDSRLLDIHRLRHIIEPNVTVWTSGTTVNASDLPIYDQTVESLADGTIVRVGATQTLQTQRGAAGRWHTTDLLVVNTDFVSSSGNADSRGPIGRIYDYRPEYANPGDYFVGDVVYRLTDATSLTGGTVFDFETNQQAMSTAGMIIRHAPEFTTYGDLRYINILDSTYVNLGAAYEFTLKYSASVAAAYDLDEGGFQTAGFEVRRRFASMLLGVNLGYNDITGETSFGFVLRPYGAGGEARSAAGGTGSLLGD
ncbi:MAG: hypothetical protein RL689_2140 [Planctomycetota bacterium]